MIYALSITVIIQIFIALAAITVPVFAPLAASDLGINPAFIGGYVSLIYLGGTFASLVSGDFIRRYGPIRVSQFCLVCGALGVSLTSLKILPLFFLGALILGVGYGPVTPASSFILQKKCPVNRMSLMFSLKQTGVPCGHALAGLLIPFLVLLVNWAGAALVVGGLCLLLALFIETARVRLDVDLEKDRSIKIGGVGESIKLVIGDQRIRKMIIATFFYAVLQLSFITYLVTFLMTDFKVSLVLAGVTLTIAQVTGGVSRVLWGVVADHFGAPQLLLGFLGIFMGIVGCSVTFFDPMWSYSWLILLCAVFGASAVGWNGVYLAELARLAPKGMAGSLTGGALFFTYLGVVAGPPIFGALLILTGSYGATFMIVSMACFFTAVPILVDYYKSPKAVPTEC
jgi:MFS family permease